MIPDGLAQTSVDLFLTDGRGLRPAAREKAFAELEDSVLTALGTYSNVHRGTGLYSQVTTWLYERAREVILDHLGLDRRRFTVVFCTPERAAALQTFIGAEKSVSLGSRDLGLPLGVTAVAAEKSSLRKGVPFQTGGGTAKMVSRHSAIWEEAPDRFEAGTPAVVNVIAFARAIQIAGRLGPQVFHVPESPASAALQVPPEDDLQELSGRALLRELRRVVIGRGSEIPTAEGPRAFTFLDNAASTPAFAPVWETVRQTWRQPENRRRAAVIKARRTISRFLNAPLARYDVIFTSNTTEAVNLVARSLAVEAAAGDEPVVLNTFLEHNSNELPWRFVRGVSLVRLPVDAAGSIDLDQLDHLLRAYNLEKVRGNKRIRIVALCGASNVLGTCPDIHEISRIVHQYQARLFIDAAQLAGHRKIDMEAEAIDYLAFSGHKMYAPFGSGGLVARKFLLNFSRAEWRRIKSSGEENVVGIAALGAAAGLLARIGLDLVEEEERHLTRTALSMLATVPGLRIFGLADPDSPGFRKRGGVISFALRHVPHNLAAEQLAEWGGIGVRNGCFCAHLLVKRLLGIPPAREALANLGLKLWSAATKSVLPGLVRVSFGLENDEADVYHLVNTLKRIAAQRVSILNRLLAWTHNATPFLPSTGARREMWELVASAAADVYGPDQIAGLSWYQRCCRKH